MLYYSSEARKSAVNRIKELIQVVGEIPGIFLSYNDAMSINYYLSMLINEVEKEDKRFG